jgi:hypothetical protein
MESERRKVFRLALILHITAYYSRANGVGIGLVQRTESNTPGERLTKGNTILSIQQRQYGIKREDLATQNVEIPERAHMLAIALALRLACQTIKVRPDPPEDNALQKAKVLSDSGNAVAMFNQHLQDASNSLDAIASTNDHRVIAKVLAEVRKLEKHGAMVGIASAAVEDTGVAKQASARAKTMAAQIGREAS